MTLPDKDSPWWPWLRMTTRQVVLLVAFMLYYHTEMARPDYVTMATLLLADAGMETVKAIVSRKDKSE